LLRFLISPLRFLSFAVAFFRCLRGRPVFRKFFAMLFPHLLDLPCPLCNAPTSNNHNQLCPDCAERLYPVPEPHCPACGGTNFDDSPVCGHCSTAGKRPWSHAYSLFFYDGAARELGLILKFAHASYVASFFAARAALLAAEKKLDFDCIVPVPVHWTRRLRRGYNQCSLIAGELSRLTGVPVAEVLARKSVGHQARRGRSERLRAMRGAFRLRRNANRVKGRKVLLLDDVFTTGATMNGAALQLKKAGAADIVILSMTRDQ